MKPITTQHVTLIGRLIKIFQVIYKNYGKEEVSHEKVIKTVFAVEKEQVGDTCYTNFLIWINNPYPSLEGKWVWMDSNHFEPYGCIDEHFI